MALNVRSLDADDSQLRDVISQSFGFPTEGWDDFVRRIGRENFRTAWSDDTLIGGLGMYRMGQWWGGRRLDAAGFAAVGIGSPWRGEGHGAQLMTTALQELHEHGEPIAALFPSTTPFYRELGFAQAGHRVGYELEIARLPRMSRSLPMTQLEPGHFTRLSELHRRHGMVTDGTLSRTVGLWERVQRAMGDELVWTWELGDGEGYVVVCKPTPSQEGTLVLRDYVALTPAAAQTIWAFAAQYGTMAETLRWWGGAIDPLLGQGPVQRGVQTHWQLRWMIRVLRVAEALSCRGYPPVTTELRLAVTDPLLPANTGRYTLTLEDGTPSVRPGAAHTIDCDIRGLSALYSGLYGAHELQRMGLLVGDVEQIEAAERVFRSRSPWMSDMF